MSWYGKIIGGSIGALFGPAGVVAGASVGHYFDYKNAPDQENNAPLKAVSMPAKKRNFILFNNTFCLFAKMAAADGKVSQCEVDTIKKFMVEPLTLSATSRRQATALFNKAKHDSVPYSRLSEEFALAFRHDQQTLAKTFEMLLAIAISNEILHPAQDRLLRKTINDFNLKADIFENIRRDLLPDTDSMYKSIGCSPDCSDDELKKAYRIASKEFHPDRLHASVSDKIRELATEKFKEINAAYETLCKLRNIT